MKHAIMLVSLWLLGFLLMGQQYVEVDPDAPGPVFSGIGAVSGGASSRLLIDYPEPERSRILDWLFLPGYGASLHHLKVEIGGDVNSSAGTEPSIAHTRDEFLNPKTEYYNRGYQFWLMKEARKRNPGIILDVLQWGAPGWIGNGEFYSQENVDLIIRFLLKAREIHGLEIDYCGIWNERFMSHDRPKNVSFVKLLKEELRKNGLNTRIVAMDEVSTFNIAKDMLKDPDLMSAVDVLGSHYQSWNPLSFNDEQVIQTGKPVWSSEDGPWRADWEGAKALARLFNRNYISFGMTKTLIWSLITAYYDNLPMPGSGLMKANTPWSGGYEVMPALRAVAHLTLFAQPGWRYIEKACGMMPDQAGSFTTLVSGDGHDLTMLIETTQSRISQQLVFKLDKTFSTREFHLWKSDSLHQLVPVRKLKPASGDLRLSLEPNTIYTLTTTSGQNPAKNPAAPARSNPAAARFRLPYSDPFTGYPDGLLPRFTQDQGGVFEVVTDGSNKILRQVVPGIGIEWPQRLNPEPYTMLGDQAMRDYAVSVDARLSSLEHHAVVMGRIGKVSQYTIEPPQGYWFRIGADGNWVLGRTDPPILQGRIDLNREWPLLKHSFPDHTRNTRTFRLEELERLDGRTLDLFEGLAKLLNAAPDPENIKLVVSFDGNYYASRDVHLDEGRTVLDDGKWNNLKIKFAGNRIYGYVNGLLVVRTTDPTYPAGMAGFGCGWHLTDFDNLQITTED